MMRLVRIILISAAIFSLSSPDLLGEERIPKPRLRPPESQPPKPIVVDIPAPDFEQAWQQSAEGTDLWLDVPRVNLFGKGDFRGADALPPCPDGKQVIWHNCIGTKAGAEGEVYSGEWRNGSREGRGQLIWKNGARYQGEFKGNNRAGEGDLRLSSGDAYSGQFLFGKLHGHVRVVYVNGDTFEGEYDYLSNKRSGRGVYIWSDGAFYEGQWRDGNPTEQGRFSRGGIIVPNVKYVNRGNYTFYNDITSADTLVYIEQPVDQSSSGFYESQGTSVGQYQSGSRPDEVVVTNTYASRNDYFICGTALLPTRDRWNTHYAYVEFVAEAKRRGLEVSQCRNLLSGVPPGVGKETELFGEVSSLDVGNESVRKVALVVGNSNYLHASTLGNPRRDAEAMVRRLSDLGFDVISGIDLDKQEFERKIVEFIDQSSRVDVSLFFYAGHGIQVGGENFMVPVDAKVEAASAIDFELVNVDKVIRYIGAGESVGIALLDACRDNPFTRSLSRAFGSRSPEIGRGLAPAGNNSGGILIGFATAPGDVADDGVGSQNSPFTKALLKHLGSKGLEIELMMKRVKSDVYHMTEGKQQPWHNSGLRTEVYLGGE